MKKAQFILLGCSIIVSVIYFSNKLNLNTGTLDQLNKILTPINNYLTGNSNISFISNDSNYFKTYCQTQFVLAPNIIEKAEIKNDTVLILENKKYPLKIKNKDDYVTLYHNTDSLYIISLCVRKKDL